MYEFYYHVGGLLLALSSQVGTFSLTSHQLQSGGDSNILLSMTNSFIHGNNFKHISLVEKGGCFC